MVVFVEVVDVVEEVVFEVVDVVEEVNVEVVDVVDEVDVVVFDVVEEEVVEVEDDGDTVLIVVTATVVVGVVKIPICDVAVLGHNGHLFSIKILSDEYLPFLSHTNDEVVQLSTDVLLNMTVPTE